MELIGTGPILTSGCIKLIELNTDNESLLISAKIFNSNNKLICEIVNNKWVTGDPFAWDITWRHQFIKIREKKGKINFELNSQKVPLTIKARLFSSNGNNEIILGGKGIFLKNQKISVENLAFVGSCFMVSNNKVEIKPTNNRMQIMVSDVSREERIKKGILKWQEIKGLYLK